jgi:hypothetical protein
MMILALQMAFGTLAARILLILQDVHFHKTQKLPKIRAKTMNLG